VSRKKPSRQAVEAALEELAEGLRRRYPHLEVRVHRPGEPLPPGAVYLPALAPGDREAILGLTSRDGGRDDDALDQ
jgi:hypothetical protein